MSGFLFAGLPGLEPGKAGPESAVLPLHHSPIISGAKVVQVRRTTKQNEKFFHNIFIHIRKTIEYQSVTKTIQGCKETSAPLYITQK